MPGHRSLLFQYDGSEADASVSPMIYNAVGGAGPLKRRKTLGLNTRFDRMLAQVHVTHSYSSDPKKHRKRARSSGSSSVSSHDLPKTPVDAYSHEGRLGRDFSVVKMNKRASNPAKSPLVQHEPKTYRKGSQMRVPTKALPMWLASTFNALAPEHPLRELLPPSPVHEDVMEVSTRNDASLPCSQEASIDRMFAFSPFDGDVRENNNTSRGAPRLPSANPIFCDAEPMPCDPTIVNAELITFHLGEDTLGFRPFSTPGSLAALEHAGISNHTRNLTRPSEPQKISTHVNTPLLSNDASVNHANFTSSPVIPQTLSEPETYLSSVHRGSSIAASNDLGPHLPTPDFPANDLMNIFSTPGPAFTVSRPVYFDSPTEDPSLSDPLEPDSYELDLDALDFRWQPFLRKSLPDTSLANQQTYTLHASATVPPVFEDHDVLSSLSPPSFCGVADDQVAMPGAPDARVEYDRHDGPFGGSPVSDHVIQQSSSPQLNGQGGAVVFAPTPGIFISPLQGAPSSPAVPGMVDAQDEQVETQGSTLSAEHTTRTTENHEPFTPPRPTQASQPTTPKKDRPSQARSTPHPPRQEQKSTVSWMLSRRSLSRRGSVGHEDIEGLFSQRSDASHDTIESWADCH